MERTRTMNTQSATLRSLAAQLKPVEWTIYPTEAGACASFACGNPDGPMLRDSQSLEVYLAGHWITGWIEQYAHQPAQFVALEDHSTCGLCPGMRIRLLAWMGGQA